MSKKKKALALGKENTKPKGKIVHKNNAFIPYRECVSSQTLGIQNNINNNDIKMQHNIDEWKQKSINKMKLKLQNNVNQRSIKMNIIINKEILNIIKSMNNINKYNNIKRFSISDDIKTNTITNILNEFKNWSGVKIRFVSKNKLNTFNNYYKIADNWFNRHKGQWFGKYYFINVYNLLNKYNMGLMRIICGKTCDKDLITLLAHYITINCLIKLGDTNITFKQSRPQSLIYINSLTKKQEFRDELKNISAIYNMEYDVRKNGSQGIIRKEFKKWAEKLANKIKNDYQEMMIQTYKTQQESELEYMRSNHQPMQPEQPILNVSNYQNSNIIYDTNTMVFDNIENNTSNIEGNNAEIINGYYIGERKENCGNNFNPIFDDFDMLCNDYIKGNNIYHSHSYNNNKFVCDCIVSHSNDQYGNELILPNDFQVSNVNNNHCDNMYHQNNQIIQNGYNYNNINTINNNNNNSSNNNIINNNTVNNYGNNTNNCVMYTNNNMIANNICYNNSYNNCDINTYINNNDSNHDSINIGNNNNCSNNNNNHNIDPKYQYTNE